eukprot:TRINITY_DN12502_c0_g1_i1.p1 TRINITY_DN12502_c0_g1~~TRINITY_DN12502_c0_g1_i1.p1  ORF type:complete len:803 (+),score=242.28 TRINITY_DN12502_c0_g1_i1:55-2409(+)
MTRVRRLAWQLLLAGGGCLSVMAELVDKSEHCSGWAASGECTLNADYMFQECAASCSSQASVTAAATSNFCADWAAAGECENNPDFMLKECAQSCGGAEPAHQPCEEWAAKGECESNPDFMLKECALSCSKVTAPKQADQKVAAEKAATEKATAARDAADRAATEAAEKAAAEKAAAQKKADEKVAAEKVAAEKAATAAKEAAEKAAAQKKADEKVAAEKVAAEKAATAAKEAAEKAAAQKKADEKLAAEKMAAEKAAAAAKEAAEKAAAQQKAPERAVASDKQAIHDQAAGSAISTTDRLSQWAKKREEDSEIVFRAAAQKEALQKEILTKKAAAEKAAKAQDELKAPKDPVKRAELAEAKLRRAQSDLQETRDVLGQATRVAMETARGDFAKELNILRMALDASEQRERELQAAVQRANARAAGLEEKLTTVPVQADEADKEEKSASPRKRSHSPQLKRQRHLGPGYSKVVAPHDQETACEQALQELCSGQLDGQEPGLEGVQQACRHAFQSTDMSPALQGLQERDLKRRADFLQSELDACMLSEKQRCDALASDSQELNEDTHFLTFFADRVECQGKGCGAGLLLAALRAAVQQSGQLVLDAFLLFLNYALGADPEKGRAAAARLHKIFRIARARFSERCSQRLAAAHEQLVRHEGAASALQRASDASRHLCQRSRLQLEALLDVVLGSIPQEHQQWLPQPQATEEDGMDAERLLRDRLAVVAWLLAFTYLTMKAAAAVYQFAASYFICLPYRLLRAGCWRCFRFLCPCRRREHRSQKSVP